MKRHIHILERGFTPFESTTDNLRGNKTPGVVYRHDFRTGFTLVETLVAISILLIVIIGPMTIAQKGIQNAYFAREQVTAVFLAQEAIEAVRKLRDSDGLDVYPVNPVAGSESGAAWDWYDALPSNCTNGTGCEYDVINDTFNTCSSGCALKIDSNGNYIHGSGSPTPFTRKVYIDEEVLDEVVSVTVDVSWNTRIFGGSTDKHVTLQTWLYNQYKRYEN